MPNSYPCTARPKRGCVAASRSGKLYTVFEIIRLVQEAVSEEICGLDDGGIGMLVAYEVERGIIRKLVKEDAK